MNEFLAKPVGILTKARADALYQPLNAATTLLGNTVTGSGAIVLAASPVIVTPTIASFVNAGHSHQNAAGGGTLDAAAIAAGVLANARVNFAAPDAIGSTTPAAAIFTTLRANSDLTLAGAPGKIKPAANSTSALQIAQADGTVFATFDTTNKRMRLGDATLPSRALEVTGSIANTEIAHIINTDAVSGGALRCLVANVNNSAPILRLNNGSDIWAVTNAGNTLMGASMFTAAPSARLQVVNTDAATATVTDIAIVEHRSSGTPAASFGTGFLINGQSSTTINRNMVRLRSLWTTATDASRATRSVLSGYDSTGERDVIGWGANGSAALLGFYPTVAAAPIAQPTTAIAAATFVANTSGIVNDTATFDGYTIGQIVKSLRNLGLLT